MDHLPNKFASEIKPFPSKGDGAIIAPYLADADTSAIGDIYYRHITNTTDSTLKNISKDINDSKFTEFTGNGFNAKMAIIATWHKVGYFHRNSDKVCITSCIFVHLDIKVMYVIIFNSKNLL